VIAPLAIDLNFQTALYRSILAATKAHQKAGPIEKSKNQSVKRDADANNEDKQFHVERITCALSK
jgi:hypothetical protein